MPKKESVNRFPVFSQRFRSLRGKTSQDKFADFLGISRPTVGFYENGDHLPDALTLSQIAKKCNVSADYLLGLSDAKTKDDTAAIAVTGFSKKSLDFIKQMANQSYTVADINADDKRHIIDVINLFLESDAELFFGYLQFLTCEKYILSVPVSWGDGPETAVIMLPKTKKDEKPETKKDEKHNQSETAKPIKENPPFVAAEYFRNELHEELDKILKRMQKTIIDEERKKAHNTHT